MGLINCHSPDANTLNKAYHGFRLVEYPQGSKSLRFVIQVWG